MSVQVRIERQGWLRASALVAALISVFLWSSYAFLDTLTAPVGATCVRDVTEVVDPVPSGPQLTPTQVPCESERHLSTDPAALAGALLGAVSLLVIRAGEHPFAAQRVKPLRFAAVLSALSPLGGAWLLAFPGVDWHLETAWFLLASGETLLAGLLLVAWLMPVREAAVTGGGDTLDMSIRMGSDGRS